ncbi:MAG: type 4a pilus biogenesis protein PilO [Oligoflexia bacterium]|nr:type 4a pilus biogenesis protein PilO [Oligoflexia bacterium]
MNAFVESILNRPKGQKIAIWIGSFAVLILVFWSAFYSGKAKEAARLEEVVSGLDGQIANEQRLANNLGAFRKEIKALEARLGVAVRQLPDRRQIPDLLSSIETLARDSGLEVKRFAPRPDVIMDYYASVPVDVELKGTYHQIATLFDEIAGLSRIVNVNDVTMREPEGVEEEAHVKVEVSCVVTTFRYLDESERIKEVTEKADAKKRKGSTKKKTTSS